MARLVGVSEGVRLDEASEGSFVGLAVTPMLRSPSSSPSSSPSLSPIQVKTILTDLSTISCRHLHCHRFQMLPGIYEYHR